MLEADIFTLNRSNREETVVGGNHELSLSARENLKNPEENSINVDNAPSHHPNEQQTSNRIGAALINSNRNLMINKNSIPKNSSIDSSGVSCWLFFLRASPSDARFLRSVNWLSRTNSSTSNDALDSHNSPPEP